jgi:signal transduction histidine kinase
VDIPSVPIWGISIQISRVFQNLLSNAIKYHRVGDRPVVHIWAEIKPKMVTIAVRDNGQGIPPEHHEKIFGLFKRLHGAEVAGSGIGLATSKRIVERHGGHIWLESVPDHGSTFYFSLPTRSQTAA